MRPPIRIRIAEDRHIEGREGDPHGQRVNAGGHAEDEQLAKRDARRLVESLVWNT